MSEPDGAASQDVNAELAEDPESLPAGTVPCDAPVLSDMPPFDLLGLLKQQLAAEEPWELSAAEIARLPRAGDEPPDTDEVPWWLSEEFTGSDAELEAAFLRNLPPTSEPSTRPLRGLAQVRR